MSTVTLGPTLTPEGISAPTFAEVLAQLTLLYQGIFGSDIYLGNDSQDGQFLAIIAQAIADCNASAINCYASFSPATAQGSSLSSLVKINGLQREIPTNSTAPCTLVGQAGTVITNGQAVDTSGNVWLLPASVVIPSGGSINVTATAQDPGAIGAGTGAINGINTPTYGWQSITNTAAATAGAPVETDGALRSRQSASVAYPAQTVIEAIRAAVANVPGVIVSTVYENDTSTTDSNGVPANSIAPIFSGGSVSAVASAVLSRKPPGIPTYGTTQVTVFDSNGIPTIIHLFELVVTPIYVSLTIKAATGYLSSTEQMIIDALVQHASNFAIGQTVGFFRLLSPANLTGDAAMMSSGLAQPQLDAISATYSVEAITLGTAPSPTGMIDVPIAFNSQAQLLAVNVVVTVS